MLHGCRTDLILKCLVHSNKDRNFSFYLLLFKPNVDYWWLVYYKSYYKNIDIYKIYEMKMTSKSLWLLREGLSVCYNETIKKQLDIKSFG